MISLGFLAFLSPGYLLALIVLPILWQIVRFTPPAPRLVEFPAIKLLKFLKQREETPRRAPWWLLLLRILLVVLVILGAAQPVLNPEQSLTHRSAIILVIDNDWSSARLWPSYMSQISQIIAIAERDNKQVQVITTTPDPDSAFEFASGALAALDASRVVKSLRPLPWPARYDLVADALTKIKLLANPDIFWFSSGMQGDGMAAVISRLQSAGDVNFVLNRNQPLLMLGARPGRSTGIEVFLRRALVLDQTFSPATYTVQAFAEDGKILGIKEVTFSDGKNMAKANLELPLAVKNKVARLSVMGHTNAGTTYLMDEMGRRHPAGLIKTQSMDTSKPLLDEYYFIERAIDPFAEVIPGTLDSVLKSDVSSIILTDANILNTTEKSALSQWINSGGTLIRFAGENLPVSSDDLTPVPVRDKPRALSGNLSWSEPLSIAPIPDQSPFRGLNVPSDIKINKQILTNNTPDLADKTWAALTDGTPLVTGSSQGRGNLVLFHIAARHDWSNLILSGLFVEMLQRVIWISQGIGAENSEDKVTLYQMLDGFGQLQTPPNSIEPITTLDLETKRTSAKYPPGYYGNAGDKKAFNLYDHSPAMETVTEAPNGVKLFNDIKSREKDLRPWLYILALILALIDTFISMNLRGLFPSLQNSRRISSLILFILALTAQPAIADNSNLQASKHLRLAYIKTFVPEIDRISQAGLEGLSQILRARTAVETSDPVGLDAEKDDLSFYPILYWPVQQNNQDLSPIAIMRVNGFLKNGGMLVIDTRDGTGSTIAQGTLADYFQNIELPALNPIEKNHVLLRSFYLLKETPGRWSNNTLWVSEGESNNFDGVSPVIVGAEDWVGAWAVDRTGKPILPITPGGEAQRETARRFGVNLVMYALTGNYKSDQVHVPAILERLGHDQ